MKNNLPVIVLRGLILLPSNELKLEFEDADSIKIVDIAELFHDGKILLVTNKDPYDVSTDVKNLPLVGTEAKIIHKMVLPNGKVRVIVRGIKRIQIKNYISLKADTTLEALITPVEDEVIDDLEEKAIIRKLLRELDFYINNVPNVGNSVLSKLVNVNNLSELVDLIVPTLPLTLDRVFDYLKEEKASERARMLLLDIYKEEELFNIERDLDFKVTKEFDKQQRDYLLREKLKMLKEELVEVTSKEDEIDELRYTLAKLDIDDDMRGKISKAINKYEALLSMAPEQSMERNYIDVLLSLPWNYTTKDNDNLKEVKESLDETHNGLDKVKERIIEYLAVKKNTDSLKSPIICLVGPPGVGKTSLAFSIAKAMRRNFVKISVGGLDDESEIVGHRKAYIGSKPGKIINGMIKAKSNNPLFLIDEIDKMTHNIHGDPVSALLSVLDPEQNKYFQDNYLDEEYDLSKVMFVATANDINSIPIPLLDRLEIIKLDGYTEYEKLDIVKTHIIPKLCKDMGIDNINIKEDAILNIIRLYTKEAGVRELERKISSIIRKVVTRLVSNEIKRLPIITSKNIETYLGLPIYEDTIIEEKIGIVNGLGYTPYGGNTIPIETNFYKGKGNLILTGSLGDVMKESAQIALSYIKSNYKEFNIKYDTLETNDIHIHALDGAIPKEGPSAGITLVTSIISSLTNTKVKSNIAMTGEVSLHGDILKIGGLKEKSLGALRNGVDTIIIPYDNLNEVEELPKEVKHRIKFIPVKNYMEVYKIIKEG
ncbi:MAG: endopeptidase La [Bacilli bacterium]|nr:endopeptidase La [Bacilli bacterium]